MMTAIRLVRPDDADALADILQDSREFLAPYEPYWPDNYYSADGQRAFIKASLERYAEGASVPHVILGAQGEVVGRITLNTIVRGPFQSCSVGYWVGARYNGHGYATAALGDMKRFAFGELGLHRIEASTLRDNVRSQRVLEHNGFALIGMAPNYLKIAGAWRDHVLFQALAPDTEEPR
ncbi:MAG TPA: GNAT family protein [Streptosporangiaceae bacterium]|nr:GNAT family protein [Streptosporangiaceae bacterium]